MRRSIRTASSNCPTARNPLAYTYVHTGVNAQAREGAPVAKRMHSRACGCIGAIQAENAGIVTLAKSGWERPDHGRGAAVGGVVGLALCEDPQRLPHPVQDAPAVPLSAVAAGDPHFQLRRFGGFLDQAVDVDIPALLAAAGAAADKVRVAARAGGSRLTEAALGAPRNPRDWFAALR